MIGRTRPGMSAGRAGNRGSMTTDRTQPDQNTRAAERRDATMPADSGAEPTPEEEAAAEQAPVGDQDAVAEHHSDMAEKGANQKGEGRIV